MSKGVPEVVIVGAARTPVGSFLGSLSRVSATTLGATAIKHALVKNDISPKEVSEVFMGCVLPAGLGQAPARQAAIGAGIPHATPATTVNKVCGSGLQTILFGVQAIQTGAADVVCAGGMESMSNAPHLLVGSRTGTKMGPLNVKDHMVHDGLWDPGSDQHMGSCAELCARDYRLTREAQDAFAQESYRRAQAAQKSGAFAEEMAPVKVTQRGGDITVAEDESPKKGGADVGKLKAVFDPAGTITAGNASSLSDGAAAVILTSAEHAKARGWTPLARFVGFAGHAHDPVWFTTAPAEAVKKACAKVGWDPKSVDLWEINEAFAVVSLVTNQLVGLDANRVNVNGGAIAIGHPIGATGTRLVVTLVYAMQKLGKKTGGASACIGGGEALTLLFERA
jgi:acetyl-CoA C-acetyltransferase